MMIKHTFPETSQENQRVRPIYSTRQHHAHFNLNSFDNIYKPTHTHQHRKSNSINSLNSILRPTSAHILDSTHEYIPRRRPTLSHDSSSKQHLLQLRTTQQELSHQLNSIHLKPRSNSISIHPKPSIGNLHQSNQLKSQKSSSSLRSKTPVLNEPIASTSSSLLSNLNLNLSGNRSSSSLINTSTPYYHSQPQVHQHPRYPNTRQQQQASNHRPAFIPVNVQSNDNHISNIGSIKNSLVESIHNFPCSLQDKLFFAAKLHAEIEVELTKLNTLPSNRNLSTHASDNQISKTLQQEMEDPVQLIQLSDRIKALAVSQLKQDLYK